jgi:protein O-mannosyl-transferase
LPMEPTPLDATGSAQAASLCERYFIKVILALTAITYLGTVKFDFVYDDYPQILGNPFIKSWQYVPQYFSSSVWKQMSPLIPRIYYRPLYLLWMRVTYSIFGQNSFGWHATAVGLHLLVTWLVYVLVKRLTGRLSVAWLTALIFGVHPIHHEVVAWISGATESLFAAFFLAGFLAYLQSERNSKTIWMSISCVLYAAALLCKETAIVLPALVFAHAWISNSSAEQSEKPGFEQRLRRAIAAATFYVPVAIVYLYVRYRVLSGVSHPLSSASFSTWLLTLPSVLVFYVKNWLLPLRLAEDYDLYYQLQPTLLHVILPALIVFAISCVIWGYRNRLGPREAAYAAAWIAIPLLPALDFAAFNPDQLVHDRYFYLPSIGASLLVALCIDRFAKSRRVVFGQSLATVVTAMVLTMALASCTIWTSRFWLDDYTLFSRAHEVAPANLTAANKLSVELIERKEYERAQFLLESAYRENSGDYRVSLNLARLQYVQRQYAKAEEYTRKSIALGPNVADPYVYLGMIQLKENHPREAQASLSRAVELNPWDAHFRTSYGIVLASNGDCTAALSQFNAALALSPDDAVTQREIFRCHAAQSVKPAPPSQLTQR